MLWYTSVQTTLCTIWVLYTSPTHQSYLHCITHQSYLHICPIYQSNTSVLHIRPIHHSYISVLHISPTYQTTTSSLCNSLTLPKCLKNHLNPGNNHTKLANAATFVSIRMLMLIPWHNHVANTFYSFRTKHQMFQNYDMLAQGCNSEAKEFKTPFLPI